MEGETKVDELQAEQQRTAEGAEQRAAIERCRDPQELRRNLAAEAGATAQEVEEPMLRFFRYSHLAGPLQEVSRRFCELAVWVVATQRRSPERSVTLRKLLEGKDAAVRNAIPA
jgi:hypothetical protein